jgi:protein-S-isoprenylcysteine O-methyltransferase Ste14
MMSSIRPVFLLLPMAGCLGSFAWGMRRFFIRQGPMSAGLRATTIAGYLSATVHSTVIVAATQVKIGQYSIGFALYALSLLLFWWAVATNRRQPLPACFTPFWPSHITITGPYQLVRHPFYCSYLLACLAGFVGTGNLWLLPTIAAMSTLYGVTAIREERQLSKGPLAEEYARYRNRTGMFCPRIRCLTHRSFLDRGISRANCDGLSPFGGVGPPYRKWGIHVNATGTASSLEPYFQDSRLDNERAPRSPRH